MPKKHEYVCSNCGYEYHQWVGKCKNCNEWNCIHEIDLCKKNHSKNGVNITKDLSELDTLSNNDGLEDVIYHATTIRELDRVLGGGIILGTTILLSGDPGIGKSTLLLQLSDAIVKQNLFSCYITGEESTKQIKIRASRLNICSDVKVVTSTNIDEIIAIVQKITTNGVIIIDSIQTLAVDNIDSIPGSTLQVKMSTLALVNAAKKYEICIIIVGHINKEGQIAGPKLLEHMVDIVLSFESDHTNQYRIIRSTKNRYGSTNEMGFFEMSNTGLIEVLNPSQIFISNNRKNINGSCIFASIEGSRSVLVEVQALVVTSYLPTPKRSAIGWDYNRLSMIIAILNSRANINLMNKEIYLNIAGGTKIYDTGLDLAVAIALLSAHKKVAIPHNMVFIGEIGLLGELRQVPNLEIRIKEIIKLGFSTIVTLLPQKNQFEQQYSIKFINVIHIKEIINLLFQ